MRRGSVSRAPQVLLGAALIAACTDAPPRTNPCDLDVLECRPATGFRLDAACSSDEPLAVRLGQGQSAFEPFEPSEAPVVHYGSQGGRHLFVALRLPSPDPEHELFQAYIQLGSPSGDGGLRGDAERALVFEGDQAASQPKGPAASFVGLDGAPADSMNEALELSGIILVLPERALLGAAELRLDIRDSCDRRGQAVHEFSWE